MQTPLPAGGKGLPFAAGFTRLYKRPRAGSTLPRALQSPKSHHLALPGERAGLGLSEGQCWRPDCGLFPTASLLWPAERSSWCPQGPRVGGVPAGGRRQTALGRASGRKAPGPPKGVLEASPSSLAPPTPRREAPGSPHTPGHDVQPRHRHKVTRDTDL